MLTSIVNNRIVSGGGVSRSSDDVKTEVLKTLNWIKEKLNGSTALAAYPVGAVYISFTDTDPGQLFGGTWEPLNEGRVLIGANSTYAVGSTGGESTHKLTVNEMPSHNHGGSFSGSGSTSSSGGHTHYLFANISSAPGVNSAVVINSSQQAAATAYGNNYLENYTIKGVGNSANVGRSSSSGSHTHTFSDSGNINSNGGDTAFNLMQPYIACYMWRRTA